MNVGGLELFEGGVIGEGLFFVGKGASVAVAERRGRAAVGWPGARAGQAGLPLVLTTTYGNAIRANIFNVEVWKSALAGGTSGWSAWGKSARLTAEKGTITASAG
ncbi:hypothetical protein [Streptomyces sp. NPDC093598]|uniref:hypothetical protein n=1 Tax=Streptomyces sp. NPDC093598 TaxID=3366046 RepID=UPI0037FBD587